MEDRELPKPVPRVKKKMKKIDNRFIADDDIQKWSIKRLIEDIYEEE